MGLANNWNILKTYLLDWQEHADLLLIATAVNIVAISIFTYYFVGALNMIEKLFTFVISGKLMGTNYILSFEQACLIISAILAGVLAKYTINFLKEAKNRNRIKLKIREAPPLSLQIRISA